MPATPQIERHPLKPFLPASRAYPLSLDKKAAAYRQMFETIGLL